MIQAGLRALFSQYVSGYGMVDFDLTLGSRASMSYPSSFFAHTFVLICKTAGSSWTGCQPSEESMVGRISFDPDDGSCGMIVIDRNDSFALDMQGALNMCRGYLDDNSSWWQRPRLCSHASYVKSGFGNVYCTGCPTIGREIEGEVVWPKVSDAM